MTTSDLPLHVQMLMALRLQVERRQHKHEGKCGDGLEDRDYQRHVGRIAECKAITELVNEMMRADLDEVADYLEAETREHERAERAPQGNRTGKRRPTPSAHHR